MTTTATADDARASSWHGLSADEVCARLGVNGVTASAQYGLNKLAEAETEPGWYPFLRQYRGEFA